MREGRSRSAMRPSKVFQLFVLSLIYPPRWSTHGASRRLATPSQPCRLGCNFARTNQSLVRLLPRSAPLDSSFDLMGSFRTSFRLWRRPRNFLRSPYLAPFADKVQIVGDSCSPHGRNSRQSPAALCRRYKSRGPDIPSQVVCRGQGGLQAGQGGRFEREGQGWVDDIQRVRLLEARISSRD